MENIRTNQHADHIQRQQDDWDEVHNQLLTIQKKSLEVSDPNDEDEKEADEIARKVVDGQSGGIHGSGGTINRKGEGEAEINPEFQSQLQGSKGSGQSLPADLQKDMGSKMGTDFGGVKIHTGSEANAMSDSINAKAFTNGQDVYFGKGQFDTNSKQGQELIAHELVHTKQQENKNAVQRKVDGHEPGKDYTSGTITANGETYPKATAASNGKNIFDTTKKNALYFKNGDAITLVSASANDMWVEVKGTAHYKVGAAETDVANTTGWMPRRSTSMTLGQFTGLTIKDETSKSGAGAISTGDPMKTVTSVVLHQTDGYTAKGTLNQYKTSGGHVGAQYLIGEDGAMSLVVPINERVGHVLGNRDVKVKEPKVADATKVTDAEMKATRDLIDSYYGTLSTANIISKDLHDYYANMGSQALYNTLKAKSWQLNPEVSNQTSIGIEVVQHHSFATYNLSRFGKDYSAKQMITIKQRIGELVTSGKITQAKADEVLKQADRDLVKNSTDKKIYPTDDAKTTALENIDIEAYAAIKKAGWKVGGHLIFKEQVGPEYTSFSKKEKTDFIASFRKLNLSPELSAQLLKSEQRDKLETELGNAKTTTTRKTEIETELDKLNKELFNFMAAYDFMIYEDVSGSQKYSMWLLVSKLVANYNLDPMQQVVGHEDVDSKVVGEGQSQAEFIRTMTEFTRNVKLINEMSVKAPSLESKDVFLAHWKYERDIIASIEKGETNNAAVLAFFTDFYTKVNAFNASGALKWIKVYQKR
ncbi:MAG: DUF4157 domain-containing protein [Bacteroidia bacterium]